MTATRTILYAAFAAIILAGCSTPDPLWRKSADEIIHLVGSEGAPTLLPSEYASLVEVYAKGEKLVLEKKIEEGDLLFKLALLKGQLLNENLSAEKRRFAEVEKVRLLEQQQLEHDRQEALAMEKENRRREAEEVRARISEQARLDAEAAVRRQAEQSKIQKDRQTAVSHTVKRGESLPQIAALPEIYNDQLLWPLVYRANRDQISDPRNLWPGQKLRIPRTYTRDELQEARRYAQEKRLN